MDQPTALSATSADLQSIAEKYISAFATLDPNIIAPIQSANYTHTFAPASIILPGSSGTANATGFATHLTHLRGVLSGFPVRAKQIWPNPSLRQVTVWAESEAEFHAHLVDGGDDGEWRYRGEYIFILTMDERGEGIEQVLEFVDSKGTEQLRVLMARAWKRKEEVDGKGLDG